MFDKYSQMHVLTEFVLIEILSVLAESHTVPTASWSNETVMAIKNECRAKKLE